MNRPGYWQRGSELLIEVIESPSSVELVNAVIDLDNVGDVLGVEILGLAARHPGIPAHFQTLENAKGDFALSYDSDADALYIRIRPGRSVDQRVKPAVVLIGASDELVKVILYME